MNNASFLGNLSEAQLSLVLESTISWLEASYKAVDNFIPALNQEQLEWAHDDLVDRALAEEFGSDLDRELCERQNRLMLMLTDQEREFALEDETWFDASLERIYGEDMESLMWKHIPITYPMDCCLMQRWNVDYYLVQANEDDEFLTTMLEWKLYNIHTKELVGLPGCVVLNPNAQF